MVSAHEILQKFTEDNVKWVDLQFVDITGALQHIAVPATELEDGFENGIAKLDASKVKGFGNSEETDMILMPDPNTYVPIPWEPNVGRVFCDISEGSGKGGFSKDSRTLGKKVASFAKGAGFDGTKMGMGIEFYLLDSVNVDAEYPERGQAYAIESHEAPWSPYGVTTPNESRSGEYPASPKDTTQIFRSRVSETLEDIFKVSIESHQHGGGSAGQCRIDTKPNDTINAAEDLISVKYAVKNFASSGGVLATFMAKPIYKENGNGLFMRQTLTKNEKNIFFDGSDKYAELSQTARYYVGGILEHAGALCAVCASTTNSYQRLGGGVGAPSYASWGRSNTSVAVRIPAYRKGDEVGKTIELRIADPGCNPYLAFSSAIAAGIDGIKKKKDCGDPLDGDEERMSSKVGKELGLAKLPSSLGSAVGALQSDNDFLKQIVPKEFVESYVEIKLWEEQEKTSRPTPYEFKKYLGV